MNQQFYFNLLKCIAQSIWKAWSRLRFLFLGFSPLSSPRLGTDIDMVFSKTIHSFNVMNMMLCIRMFISYYFITWAFLLLRTERNKEKRYFIRSSIVILNQCLSELKQIGPRIHSVLYGPVCQQGVQGSIPSRPSLPFSQTHQKFGCNNSNVKSWMNYSTSIIRHLLLLL